MKSLTLYDICQWRHSLNSSWINEFVFIIIRWQKQVCVRPFWMWIFIFSFNVSVTISTRPSKMVFCRDDTMLIMDHHLPLIYPDELEKISLHLSKRLSAWLQAGAWTWYNYYYRWTTDYIKYYEIWLMQKSGYKMKWKWMRNYDLNWIPGFPKHSLMYICIYAVRTFSLSTNDWTSKR